MTPRICARELTLAYGGGPPVVDNLGLDIENGTCTAVIGPNGCGKSTVLRAMGRMLAPRSGSVVLDGRLIHSMPTREVARVVGMLPQSPVAPDGLTVADLVARGRHPHQAWYRQWSPSDEAAVDDALRWTGTLDLATRVVDELSGGQRQRAWIAMALAQDTEVLLLDEPTTFLDLAHQIDVLDLIDRLHREAGRTVVMVLHDLNLAARYADRLVAMHAGRIVSAGPPAKVLTEALLKEVFGLHARVIADPVSDTPLVLPYGRRATGSAAIDGIIRGQADAGPDDWTNPT
ncbi:ABC transporter ATP-binding protein [Asanoa siamensis]|uniref:Cobalamin/Fe3+-siderophore ABC transporter ATP-binding protein n=1 Tax=Asanoa siamensis TaxID=926357 RepID=A0ABQ4D5L0_9ACTN|nr:ABC transporter ATP-binding protein [Asanoa siamensis]GIF78548.1 cobalamin/Fe3+-siderophore ABC transporter ATP-binding protein [Asanoa siamensis]